MAGIIGRPPISRRVFLRSAVAAAGGIALASSLAGLRSRQRDGQQPAAANGYGPIAPVADRTTGLPLLRLPRGFSYQSFGWTGDLMDDGTPTPDLHDGMAVVDVGRRRGAGRELTLIRNHERGPIGIGNPLPFIGTGRAPVYDGFTLPGVVAGMGGGTTALFFSRGRFTGSRATLGGTLTNCAGGPTPWGSWLSCEEIVVRGAQIGARDHGFVFEVPAPRRGQASAVPIEDMGLMKHEAVAVDPRTGFVYLTEDNGPHSGFYRFRPHRPTSQPGDLEAGGTLEMLKVVDADRADLRSPVQGERFAVEWVEIPQPNSDPEDFEAPTPVFPRILGRGRSGPYLQGESQGAARFSRGEGCAYAHGVVYFVDTTGGAAGKGVVWALQPPEDEARDQGQLTAIFVSPDEDTADNPDNITISPALGILVCEDGGGKVVDGERSFGTRLIGINGDGSSYLFAENNMRLEAPIFGKPLILPGDYRDSEFAGAAFAPLGDYLFVNIQRPGVTFAIEGPWWRGGL